MTTAVVGSLSVPSRDSEALSCKTTIFGGSNTMKQRRQGPLLLSIVSHFTSSFNRLSLFTLNLLVPKVKNLFHKSLSEPLFPY